MKSESANRKSFCAQLAATIVAIAATGCVKSVPPQVVVFTSVESEVSQPIFAEYANQTGIKVRAAYGSGSKGANKLVREIAAHQGYSRADVYWDYGIFDMLWLEREGLLAPFTSSAAIEFPNATRSVNDTWYALAYDARVLAINTRQVAEARRPKSIRELTDPQWYERTAIARPSRGKSAVHTACIFQVWGDAIAQEFFIAVKRNARILETDREVAHAVATGSLAFALTNASDAVAEIEAGAPLILVYPDQGTGELGTMFVPTTVALVKDSPDREPAERLLDHLLSAEVAKQLADGPSALVPIRADAVASDRVKTPKEVRATQADFKTAFENWDRIAKFLGAEFAVGE